ncbi:LOW QUALITY PROTEIN: serine/threonine-protein kinase TAO1-B-like [Salvia splendens]|uniref:LOW QUALITY PROTEIN: serine/threonine-protein kinase TAO1-B-like n=1 Tax=Salvia splendens TaxID=180675 RepID=UPI001C26A663|nr:LOW QUALITY PROTEIN: serine/threonine-protein kinase TAO1-B-like [Salvia splendens]
MTSSTAEKLCRRFSLAEINLATKDFSREHVIGKGGFGEVYRGFIDNGSSVVAIKRCVGSNSSQGQTEFATETEIETLSKFRHHNLVSLIGYCDEDGEMILVYEYMLNGTLADRLHKNSEGGSTLSWNERLKICIGAGRGLDYLHSGCSIIHRDVKPTNILLDQNFIAKVSDFGLAKHLGNDFLQSHVFTFVKGSFGYFDPSYFISGYLTRASDTYSFGVVLLEVLTGRPAVDKRLVENELCMSMWAQEMIRNGKAGQIVASNLKGDITQDCLKTFVEVVKRCLHPEPKKRLTMTRVVAKLELALEQQEMKGTTTQKLQFWPHWNRGPKTTISARSAQKDENEVAMDTGSTVDVDKLSKAISGLSVHHTINMLPIYVPSFPLAEVRYIREDFQVPEIKHMIDDVIPGSLSFSEDTEVNVVHRVLKYRNEEYFQRRECKKEREFFAQVSKVWHRPDDFIPRSMSSSSEREVNLFHRVLKSGQEASIKWLDDMPEPDFIEQVSKVSSLKHENVAQPIGYCLNGGRQLLAYGFSTRRSLHDILRVGEGDMDGLSWNQRINIAVGIARGLCYIHEKHLVHHDLRSSNVFLFDDETAKITWAEDLTGVKSCYDAPEWPQCTQKSNVFSFGVILLELLTVDHKMHPMSHLRTWLDSGKVHEIVDARLKGDCPQKEVEMTARVAVMCLLFKQDCRPDMRIVVQDLMKCLHETKSQHSQS